MNTASDAAGPVPERVGRARQIAFGTLILCALAVFVGLGVWQLERRVWKLDLIRSTDERVHAEPADAPGPSSWADVNAADDAYRRVRARGHFGGAEPALVQAVTRLGPGFWVVQPFVTDRGFTVLVNRGFVTKEEAADLPPASGGDAVIVGLLRVSEPGGAFLRSNDPAADRWYSRDVAAISASRGLGSVAPYFIDAEALAKPAPHEPVGGLTVVAFRNHHLLYALTWFGLAAMLAVWTVLFMRQHRDPDRQ